MQKILITGSAGLIGNTLIKLLTKKGYSVCTLDIRTDKINLNSTNILNTHTVKNLLNGCTGVIHLAAVSRVIWGEEDPELCRRVNVDGTRNIINACLELETKPWLIYASSREIYGQQDVFPVHEDCLYKPHNHYARSKLDAERLVNIANDNGLKTAILRFSNVFGGFQDYSERVVPAFCYNALNNLPLKVNGKDSLLDFTYVDDIADGIIRVVQYLLSNNKSLPPIHFTTGIATSLFELAKMVVDLTDSTSDIFLKPKDSIYPSKFYGDNSRAKSLLGWQPTHNLNDGLTEYIQRLMLKEANLSSSIMVNINENSKSYTRLSA